MTDAGMTWINLQEIRLSEKSQIRKITYLAIPLRQLSRKEKVAVNKKKLLPGTEGPHQ